VKQKYVFVATLADTYPVVLICRVLGVARSGDDAWKRRPASSHAKQDAALTSHIQTIFAESRRTSGSPRVHAALRAEGVRWSKKRVARLMRVNALVGRRPRRSIATTDSRHHEPIAPNQRARNVQTGAPNQVWVTDITYLPTREGWLYLAVVLDLYARRVGGWSMDATLERTLVIRAREAARKGRQPNAGLLHHRDRGSHYASADYQLLLAQAGMTPSMSRQGNCWDNAVMESFFASLTAEIGVEVFDSHVQARSCVFDDIERFYNRQRRHSTLAYLTPADYEKRWSEQHIAA
jgi:transposase InsO family protein